MAFFHPWLPKREGLLHVPGDIPVAKSVEVSALVVIRCASGILFFCLTTQRVLMAGTLLPRVEILDLLSVIQNYIFHVNLKEVSA